MAPKRSRLATLEPDGTVLEELIEDLQTEYGTPTTPQEYRLHIKVATAEEAKELASTQNKTEPNKSSSSASGRRRNRGRRRSRRRPKTDSPPSGGATE